MTRLLDDLNAGKGVWADSAYRSAGVVHFTPKHPSWLNQIEVWFSILVRKLLRRSSFTSQADLKANILAFVDYFNRILAKPFKWNYTSKPLVS